MGKVWKIDKPCVDCGVMMYDVYPGKRYCDKCRKERFLKKAESKPKKLTLQEIMREADKEGLQKARTLLRKSGRSSRRTARSFGRTPFWAKTRTSRKRQLHCWLMSNIAESPQSMCTGNGGNETDGRSNAL